MSARRTVDVDGRRTSFLDAGTGTTLVLLHGLGIGAVEWSDQIPRFVARGIRCVAPDLPGCGESDGPAWGLDVPETGAWLTRFAEAIGVERAVWLGHSIAAQPALELAATRPERTAGLVLASPTGVRSRAPRLRQAAALAVDAFREPSDLIGMVLRRYASTSKRHILGTWFQAAEHRPFERAPGVLCPTLLVGGDRDPIVPVAYLHALAARLAHAEVTVLHGGAHGAALSERDAFVEAVARFVTVTVPSSEGPAA